MEAPNFQRSVFKREAVFTVFFKRVLMVSKMVVVCVAVNCSTSNRINSPRLSFHRLPKLNESNKQIFDVGGF